MKGRRGATEFELALGDEDAINGLLDEAPACLDISGLGHHVWAPVVRVAVERRRPLHVMYTEPHTYRAHRSPAFPELFDLSTSFRGLAPLPGFAKLTEPDEMRPKLFIAFLGFEGRRPNHLALTLESEPEVVSIVGVPGFRAEYPTFTVACNAGFLSSFHAHDAVRFAAAHCPCEAYEALQDIRRDFPEHYFYIAPVGTKPHALGAICYAALNTEDAEVMYDHPQRRPKRTEGIGPVHLYSLNLEP